MRRIIYLSITTLLALTAAWFTLRAQHTVSVVFATHDLQVGAVIQSNDIEVRNIHEDSLTTETIDQANLATNHHVVWPIAAGAPVLQRNISRTGTKNPLAVDYLLPPGDSAVAIPVNPAQAVGGVLNPGDHVDVYATPTAGQGTLTGDLAEATSLGHDVIVLQLRDDQGNALTTTTSANVHGLNFGSGKLGSVVLAVPSGDVAKYASAAANSSFYLALGMS